MLVEYATDTEYVDLRRRVKLKRAKGDGCPFAYVCPVEESPSMVVEVTGLDESSSPWTGIVKVTNISNRPLTDITIIMLPVDTEVTPFDMEFDEDPVESEITVTGPSPSPDRLPYVCWATATMDGDEVRSNTARGYMATTA